MSFEPSLIKEEKDTDREKKEVCRDFKKGDCRRRERCVFHHPKLKVCMDFQLRECFWPRCKYVHVTKSEEEVFDGSGVLPDQVEFPGLFDNRIGNKRSYSAISSGVHKEICWDFEKGDCQRRDRCKFFHPKLMTCFNFQNKKCDREDCRFLHLTKEVETTYENHGILPDHIDQRKLRMNRIMFSSPSPSSRDGGGSGSSGDRYGKRRGEPVGYSSIDTGEKLGEMADQASVAVLSVENEALKAKVLEMQQQISDLRKMNMLYERNQNYRNNGHNCNHVNSSNGGGDLGNLL